MEMSRIFLVVMAFSTKQSLAKEANYIGAAVQCLNSHCPMNTDTMTPSPLCVVKNCISALGKCVLHSDCRSELLCVSHCTAPLAKTSDAKHFVALQSCMKDHCPEFPPSKSCVALRCGEEALACAAHSKCRAALECSDKCTSKVSETLNATMSSPSPKEIALPLKAPAEDPAAEAIGCLNENCPMHADTMTPSPVCVVKNCASALGKCVIHSACRSELLCMSHCTAPLVKTPDADHFLAVQACLKDHCPGFPPSKSCVALHCSIESVKCAAHTKCREALLCADSCSAKIALANNTVTIV